MINASRLFVLLAAMNFFPTAIRFDSDPSDVKRKLTEITPLFLNYALGSGAFRMLKSLVINNFTVKSLPLVNFFDEFSKCPIAEHIGLMYMDINEDQCLNLALKATQNPFMVGK